MTNGALRLGIDLDGVVADFNQGWVDRYNRDFDAAVRLADVDHWDAPLTLTHFEKMGSFWRWARTCGEGATLFRVLDPYPGAIDALRRLDDAGFEVVIVTTKPHFAIDDTHAWLADHEVPATEVHIVDDKTVVTCDLYVDDADHNLRALLRGHPSATILRYIQPWNDPIDGALDVASWPEVEAEAAELS